MFLQDVAALESQPLLGFFLREERSGDTQKLQFKLYHKNTLFYIFKADDFQTAQRCVCSLCCALFTSHQSNAMGTFAFAILSVCTVDGEMIKKGQ